MRLGRCWVRGEVTAAARWAAGPAGEEWLARCRWGWELLVTRRGGRLSTARHGGTGLSWQGCTAMVEQGLQQPQTLEPGVTRPRLPRVLPAGTEMLGRLHSATPGAWAGSSPTWAQTQPRLLLPGPGEPSELPQGPRPTPSSCPQRGRPVLRAGCWSPGPRDSTAAVTARSQARSQRHRADGREGGTSGFLAASQRMLGPDTALGSVAARIVWWLRGLGKPGAVGIWPRASSPKHAPTSCRGAGGPLSRSSKREVWARGGVKAKQPLARAQVRVPGWRCPSGRHLTGLRPGARLPWAGAQDWAHHGLPSPARPP